jgi:2'-5' RNA ligase
MSALMYFIAIVLPEELNERILDYKRMMEEQFDCKVGLKSPAHITIVPPFWLEEEKEERLLDDVRSISSMCQKFDVTTNNFSAFKPKTIFIDVIVNVQLAAVKDSTDQFFKNNEFYKIKIDTRPFHPHITIATRDLHKKAFHEAWPLFQHKEFKEEWLASGLSVLRHNRRNWEVIYTAYFSENG